MCKTSYNTRTVERSIVVARASNSQSRDSGFESSFCRFEALIISFTPRCSSSLSCINEYLAIDSGGYLCTNSFLTLIAAWLKASQGSRDEKGVNCKAL